MVTLILPRALESTPVGVRSVSVIRCMTPLAAWLAATVWGDNITATAKPIDRRHKFEILLRLAVLFFMAFGAVAAEWIFDIGDTIVDTTAPSHGV